MLALLGGTATGAVGLGVWRVTQSSDSVEPAPVDLAPAPAVVADVTRDDPLAYVGARYLATAPEEASVDRLTELVGVDPAVSDDRAALEAEIPRVRDQIADEFEREETVRVDGWYLARTEARLCALIALS